MSFSGGHDASKRGERVVKRGTFSSPGTAITTAKIVSPTSLKRNPEQTVRIQKRQQIATKEAIKVREKTPKHEVFQSNLSKARTYVAPTPTPWYLMEPEALVDYEDECNNNVNNRLNKSVGIKGNELSAADARALQVAAAAPCRRPYGFGTSSDSRIASPASYYHNTPGGNKSSSNSSSRNHNNSNNRSIATISSIGFANSSSQKSTASASAVRMNAVRAGVHANGSAIGMPLELEPSLIMNQLHQSYIKLHDIVDKTRRLHGTLAALKAEKRQDSKVIASLSIRCSARLAELVEQRQANAELFRRGSEVLQRLRQDNEQAKRVFQQEISALRARTEELWMEARPFGIDVDVEVNADNGDIRAVANNSTGSVGVHTSGPHAAINGVVPGVKPRRRVSVFNEATGCDLEQDCAYSVMVAAEQEMLMRACDIVAREEERAVNAQTVAVTVAVEEEVEEVVVEETITGAAVTSLSSTVGSSTGWIDDKATDTTNNNSSNSTIGFDDSGSSIKGSGSGSGSGSSRRAKSNDATISTTASTAVTAPAENLAVSSNTIRPRLLLVSSISSDSDTDVESNNTNCRSSSSSSEQDRRKMDMKSEEKEAKVVLLGNKPEPEPSVVVAAAAEVSQTLALIPQQQHMREQKELLLASPRNDSSVIATMPTPVAPTPSVPAQAEAVLTHTSVSVPAPILSPATPTLISPPSATLVNPASPPPLQPPPESKPQLPPYSPLQPPPPPPPLTLPNHYSNPKTDSSALFVVDDTATTAAIAVVAVPRARPHRGPPPPPPTLETGSRINPLNLEEPLVQPNPVQTPLPELEPAQTHIPAPKRSGMAMLFGSVSEESELKVSLPQDGCSEEKQEPHATTVATAFTRTGFTDTGPSGLAGSILTPVKSGMAAAVTDADTETAETEAVSATNSSLTFSPLQPPPPPPLSLSPVLALPAVLGTHPSASSTPMSMDNAKVADIAADADADASAFGSRRRSSVKPPPPAPPTIENVNVNDSAVVTRKQRSPAPEPELEPPLAPIPAPKRSGMAMLFGSVSEESELEASAPAPAPAITTFASVPSPSPLPPTAPVAVVHHEPKPPQPLQSPSEFKPQQPSYSPLQPPPPTSSNPYSNPKHPAINPQPPPPPTPPPATTLTPTATPDSSSAVRQRMPLRGPPPPPPTLDSMVKGHQNNKLAVGGTVSNSDAEITAAETGSASCNSGSSIADNNNPNPNAVDSPYGSSGDSSSIHNISRSSNSISSGNISESDLAPAPATATTTAPATATATATATGRRLSAPGYSAMMKQLPAAIAKAKAAEDISDDDDDDDEWD